MLLAATLLICETSDTMKSWGQRCFRLGVLTVVVALPIHYVFTVSVGFVNGGYFPNFAYSLTTLTPTLIGTVILGVVPLMLWGLKSLWFTFLPLYGWKSIHWLLLNDTKFTYGFYMREFWPILFEGPLTVLVIGLCYRSLEDHLNRRGSVQ